jgi:hypothetical protein
LPPEFLHDDCDNLLRELDGVSSPYDYRMNYPLARFVALAQIRAAGRIID